ncbi:sigma-54 interaction domain-containing protein [Terriglobus tenax]|uniref:sigma-54 interaction domain-containing protein n=1 Tax=Terriglobus tenax TaxID=1111115 RepID=UPI0021E0C1E8|nr:sigma-54 dependent transcriptional regulator [Terriglobus tenax]
MEKIELVGSSRKMQNLEEDISMVAPIACCVLIQGETGTGKELVAKAIHDAGPRRHKPFIALNCAAIPAPLLESELFGHEKGAFTGAIAQTIGKFQAAHGGTLFLDEIGDMPLELQPKILRVLQERQVERLGSNRSMPVDVRVIAATHAPLEQMVVAKEFRADLFYRLNVYPIEVPALRSRRDDIPELVEHFVRVYAERLGKRINSVPANLLVALQQYHWPGNVRELQNFVERAVITSHGTTLEPRESSMRMLLDTTHEPATTLVAAERTHIERTLQETNWVIGGRYGAAMRLGLPRTTLLAKMKKLGLTRARTETHGLLSRAFPPVESMSMASFG